MLPAVNAMSITFLRGRLGHVHPVMKIAMQAVLVRIVQPVIQHRIGLQLPSIIICLGLNLQVRIIPFPAVRVI